MASVLCSPAACKDALRPEITGAARKTLLDKRARLRNGTRPCGENTLQTNVVQRIVAFATPSVAIMVRNRVGKQTPMLIQERRAHFVRLWVEYLKPRLRTVNWEVHEAPSCGICCETITPATILVNPHTPYEHHYDTVETGCQHRTCLNCILHHAFQCRGMLQVPNCPFCRQPVDERSFAPFSVKT
jgi:hypothetical protein